MRLSVPVSLDAASAKTLAAAPAQRDGSRDGAEDDDARDEPESDENACFHSSVFLLKRIKKITGSGCPHPMMFRHYAEKLSFIKPSMSESDRCR